MTDRLRVAISVGDTAERAMVNRTTLYVHYQDKYDPVVSMCKDAIALRQPGAGTGEPCAHQPGGADSRPASGRRHCSSPVPVPPSRAHIRQLVLL